MRVDILISTYNNIKHQTNIYLKKVEKGTAGTNDKTTVAYLAHTTMMSFRSRRSTKQANLGNSNDPEIIRLYCVP